MHACLNRMSTPMPIELETADQLMEMASHDIAEVVRAAAALAEAALTCAAAGSRREGRPCASGSTSSRSFMTPAGYWRSPASPAAS